MQDDSELLLFFSTIVIYSQPPRIHKYNKGSKRKKKSSRIVILTKGFSKVMVLGLSRIWGAGERDSQA